MKRIFFGLISGYLGSILFINSVKGQANWVWNTNNKPSQPEVSNNNNNNNGGNRDHTTLASQNSNYGEFNFGNKDRITNNGGRKSIFPDSPSRPSSSISNKDNSALPVDSIRVVNNGNSEARLIPGAANFVSNALQNIGGGGGGGGGNSGGGGGGLFSIGGNLIGSLFQSVPQFAGSALQILLGRPPKGNSGSSSSSSSASRPGGATTLPASGSSFPILNPGGSGGSGSGGGGGGLDRPAGNTNNSPPVSNSGNCKCISLNSCFLPSRPGASCEGGNIMCCQTSTRTGTIDDLQPLKTTRDTKDDTKFIRTPTNPADIRLGLLENIVKGSSNVVDDALDLLLQRYYTEEDQQRLATRVLKAG